MLKNEIRKYDIDWKASYESLQKEAKITLSFHPDVILIAPIMMIILAGWHEAVMIMAL